MVGSGMNELSAPALVVVFELERPPRIINGDRLTEAELRRVVDWIEAHGTDGLDFSAWLDRHLATRRLRVTLLRAWDDRVAA